MAPQLTLDTSGKTYSNREQLLWERELLGLYLSSHPLSEYETLFKEQCVPISELEAALDGKTVRIGGSILESREILTKNGQKMAFIKLADLQSEVELILFPSIYQQTVGIWTRDNVVLLTGKVSAKDREGNLGSEIKVLVDDAREVTAEQAAAYQVSGKKPKKPKPGKAVKTKKTGSKTMASSRVTEKRIYIRLKDTSEQDKLMTLKQLIDNRTGLTPVVLVVGEESSKKIIKLPNAVEPNQQLLEDLASVFGEPAVRYQ